MNNLNCNGAWGTCLRICLCAHPQKELEFLGTGGMSIMQNVDTALSIFR